MTSSLEPIRATFELCGKEFVTTIWRKRWAHHTISKWFFSQVIRWLLITVGPSQDCLPPARWVSRCQRRCRGWRAHKLSFTTAQLEVHISKAPFGKTKWVQSQKRQRIFKKSRAITQRRAVEAPPGQVLWLTQCQPVNRQLKWYRLPSKSHFKSIWRGMKSLMNPLVKDPYTYNQILHLLKKN